MTGRRRYLALGVVCTTSLVATLDHSILNVALPTLARELHASTSDLQWIVDSYILAFAGLLLVGGSIADRFGRRKVLQTGLIVFGTASTVGAWSGSASVLVLCRGAMGVGAALFFPSAVAIVTSIFPDARERGRALGIWSVMAGLGIALGPIFGGLLLSAFWWGSVFLANLPIVALALIVGRLTIPESRNPVSARFDPLGMLLSIAGTGLLVWVTIRAPLHGWGSTNTLGGFAVAAATLTAFVMWESHTEHPMLDVGLFRNARFSAANLATASSSFALTGGMFVLTLLLQSVLGYSPLATGIRLLPMAIAFIGFGVVAPRIVEHIGTKLTVAIGLGVGIVGLLLLLVTDEHSGTFLLSLAMIGVGGGSGLTLAPTTEAVVGAAPPGKTGAASGVLGTMRQASAALGVAVVGSILVSRYQSAIDDGARRLELSHRDLATARGSLGGAFSVSHHLGAPAGRALRAAAREDFVRGMHSGTLAGIAVLVVGSVLALRYLPAYARSAETAEAAKDQTLDLTAKQ